MNLTTARQNFKYLENGKIYFNHASMGPMPVPVAQKVQEYLNERSGDEIDNFQKTLKTIKELKSKLGALLKCEPDRIASCENVSSALNLLANGLKWEKGDRIILGDIEFPSNVYPFLNLRKQGVEVDFVKSANGILSIDDYEKLITEKTKLISVSHVQFLTGYKIDLEKLGEICRQKNIIFSVDGIQSAGTAKVDVKKMHIDFFTGGSHKWLLGLQGLTYFYVNKELQEKIEQKNVGWISVKNSWDLTDYNLDLRSSADRYQTGTQNTIGLEALNASLDFFNSFGFDEIEKKVIANSKYFLSRLMDNNFEPVLSDIENNGIAGIVSVKIQNPNEVEEKLKDKNIICTVREGILRFSPHFYNTKEEIDVVIDKLKTIESK
ncbi:MAG: aminotransferase class V-fold PLP-dependent enzyme [Ignavibacteria bacterium]|jgi:selenocysteine lyase/cysteine desulfurase